MRSSEEGQHSTVIPPAGIKVECVRMYLMHNTLHDIVRYTETSIARFSKMDSSNKCYKETFAVYLSLCIVHLVLK